MAFQTNDAKCALFVSNLSDAPDLHLLRVDDRLGESYLLLVAMSSENVKHPPLLEPTFKD